MELSEFLDLQTVGKLQQILSNGQPISHSFTRELKVYLYKLFDFYVELNIRVDGEVESYEYINAGSLSDMHNKYPHCSLF